MRRKIEAIERDFGGDLFIDIGGNVGMWSGQLYDDYKKIIFVEPSSVAIEQAKKNINDSDNKINYFKNLCSNESKIKKSIFSSTHDSGNFSIFAKDLYNNVQMSEHDIETITVDELLELDFVKNSDKILIKIDTEGADLDVLLGSLKFIKQKRPTIIMEAHFHMYFDQKKYETVFSFLKENDYSIEKFKYPGYINSPHFLFDGKHNGEQMYDLHYQMIFEPK